MAKAVFQRNQKVWVESVGAWSIVERIVPIWAKGFDEPVKVTYDVGFGREFLAQELRAEDRPDDAPGSAGDADSGWRLLRARNKWQTPDECAHHPYPGTYPIVVTDTNDWGGWRTPGAEYDRDPAKIERQARLIQMAPRLQALAREIVDLVAEAPHDAPLDIRNLADRARALEAYVNEVPATAQTQAIAAE